MPTEITTEMRHTTSHGAEKSRVQSSSVIEANKAVTRQASSVERQTMPSSKESSPPSNQQLQDAAESMNQHVQSLKRDLHFSINEDTGETVISVVDSESKQLIRTIPTDEFISIQQQFNQSVGLLLNASV